MSQLEQRLDFLRRRAGLVLAPLLFAFILSANFESLADKPTAHRLAAVMAAVVVLWVTEAIPMALTALLGATACVVLQVAPAKNVFAPFADQLMFLFIGSFMLARAIELHGLDRRLALSVLTLKAVGGSPSRVLFAFGATTAFISAWISNTATTAMMFAIGLSILKVLRDESPTSPLPEDVGTERKQLDPRYATGLMLMTSFAASIGGLATPIGTPPNVIGLNFIRQQITVNGAPAEVTFFEWCLIGVPVVVVLFLFLFAYLNWLCPAGVRELAGGREYLERQRQQLGPWTRGQISTLVAFVVMVALWIAPGVVALGWGETSDAYKWCKLSLPEAVPALLGAGLLFLLPGERGRPALTWPEATQIDWGVVLLYGGGFAFGMLAQETELANVIGKNLITLLPNAGSFGFLVAATLVATLVSEATSNTASANIVVPVVISMALAAGVDPLEPALGATFGCSLGFMLPVSTPCNAIVYGSGLVPLGRMIRYGVLLDIAGTVVIVAVVKMLGAMVR
ncbi:MAG: SLC13/DASS family transporter [Planctomycetota bacterium]|nr:MAG: SLC13/DASS family transporter [Planctomycetota bacterium]